jgi:3-deoxy-manno-octulosonate cytidylyltransferase (CMP-KDO synthetase)
VRFPGKPLADLGGRAVVEWVHSAAMSCPHFARVLVATDDERIAECVRRFGGEVELTRGDHATGSDRVAEVAARYPSAEVIVNVQGDQPFVSAAQLSELVAPYLEGLSPHMTTLACPLDPVRASDPNVVKVVCDREGNALYFSRAQIPFDPGHKEHDYLQHLGLYAFRADFMQRFSELSPTPLEECEQLEQLRVLEHGYKIVVRKTNQSLLEVNTPEDLAAASALVPRVVAS